MLLKLSKVALAGMLFVVLGLMSIAAQAKDEPAPAKEDPDVKVIEYKINISDLGNFRISEKQKKKIIARIVGGFNAWNNLPGVCVKFKYKGLTTKARYKMGDKKNVVTFSMDEDEFNKAKKRVKSADALAVTSKAGDEFDVLIYGEGFLGMGRNGLYVNFPGSMANDLQSAMAHEAGHALGLGHSTKKNAVMYKRLPRTKRRTPIENDDIKKARELYPCPKDKKVSYVDPGEDDAYVVHHPPVIKKTDELDFPTDESSEGRGIDTLPEYTGDDDFYIFETPETQGEISDEGSSTTESTCQ
jgi:hypothetical protein